MPTMRDSIRPGRFTRFSSWVISPKGSEGVERVRVCAVCSWVEGGETAVGSGDLSRLGEIERGADLVGTHRFSLSGCSRVVNCRGLGCRFVDSRSCQSSIEVDQARPEWESRR